MRTKPYVLIELPTDFIARMHALNSLDTTVQPRHEKGPINRKDQAEIYTIVNALELGLSLPIPLPASVIHSDRPDIVIDSAVAKIGIEIVEAVSETIAAMDCEMARLPNAPEFHWAMKQLPGEKQKTAAGVRELVFNNYPGDGFTGNGAAEWAAAIAHFVRRKIETVSKPKFQRFEKSWLLVYDNWREPARNLEEAGTNLQSLMNDMKAFGIFDLILVLDDERLRVFEPTHF